MIKNTVLWALTLGTCLCHQVSYASPPTPESFTNSFLNESVARHDERMAWWREARFGMFIHWGLYSEAAGYWDGKPTSGAGEWMMNDFQIPLSQYAKLVPGFDPEQFNADEWVKIAKDAGMKYIVITAKHHEGFGMFPSALTDWCIKSTPFHRDPLKELAAACQKNGIKLCFYYSIMDWHSPLYAPRKPWNDQATNPPDFDAYDNYLKGQLKELLTGYGPIGLLWFDGQWENTWTYDRGVDLYQYVRRLQPNIIVNNRVGTGQSLLPGQVHVGDYLTPEQTIPSNGYGPGVDWETCMTMNDTWGYKRGDDTWKSTTLLIHNLIDITSKGGNYLLNVGPTAQGLIPEASIERLREIGDWMKINGVAIYGTTASPFTHPLPWGRCTTRRHGNNTTLYLHVFDWPANGELRVPGLENKIRSATLLANGKKLAVQNRQDMVIISVPATAPDKISSTIILKFKGAPRVISMPVSQAENGSIILRADEADLHGSTLQDQSIGGYDNIGYWFNPDEWIDWECEIKRPGTFIVTADIAAPSLASFDVSLAGQTLHCHAPATGNYANFQEVSLGKIQVPTEGKFKLAVHPVTDGWQPINLEDVTLKLSEP